LANPAWGRKGTEGERRRTKVIPRFTDERSAMKLVFAALIRCSERWSRVSITDIERHQLRLLRAELGMDSEEFRNLDPVGGGSPPLACALLYRKELHAALACLLPRSPHPRTQRLVLDRTERAIAVAALRAKYPRYPECARRPRVHRTDILGGLIHEYEPVAA